MSKPDIVTRLRKFARDFSFTDTHSDFSLTESADEIERLRGRLLGEENHADIHRIEADRFRAERDEARRLYCIAFQEITENLGEKNTTESIAEEMGWDCFKENTND